MEFEPCVLSPLEVAVQVTVVEGEDFDVVGDGHLDCYRHIFVDVVGPRGRACGCPSLGRGGGRPFGGLR